MLYNCPQPNAACNVHTDDSVVVGMGANGIRNIFGAGTSSDGGFSLNNWPYSSVGRALGSYLSCRWFDPNYGHQTIKANLL